MSYKMFLDDERFPSKEGFVIVRSSQEAIDFVVSEGVPEFISFDHDLGGEDTSMIFINWLITAHLNDLIVFPSNFSYYVHSQNPIGKKNIEGLLESFLNFIKE